MRRSKGLLLGLVVAFASEVVLAAEEIKSIARPAAVKEGDKVTTSCGPFSQWASESSCICNAPTFDVDPYGRLEDR